ncbi:hypothetical protein LLG95_16645 [bacterium]|nr:hypothetical protein [bacterium]
MERPFSRDELNHFFEAGNQFPAEDPGRYTPLFLMMLAVVLDQMARIQVSRGLHEIGRIMAKNYCEAKEKPPEKAAKSFILSGGADET